MPNVKWGAEASKIFSKIETSYQKIICQDFTAITIQAGFAILFLEENNKHVSKMVFEVMETSLKEYMTIENALTIHLQLAYLQMNLNKHNIDTQPIQIDLSHSQQFMENCRKLTNEFVRKNFFKVQRTKYWKDLDEDQKNEFTSKSGFIFN